MRDIRVNRIDPDEKARSSVSPQGLQLSVDKMRDAGVHSQAIDVFRDYYRQLEKGVTGFILEDSIDPLTDPQLLGDVEIDDRTAQQALAATVMIKLNGGLGTSMGMDEAKSLLPVREHQSFLDIIVAQVRAARASYEVKLPLIFMNSFRTRDDTLTALGATTTWRWTVCRWISSKARSPGCGPTT